MGCEIFLFYYIRFNILESHYELKLASHDAIVQKKKEKDKIE